MDDIDHRAIAVATFNRCWELLEERDRSSDGDLELLSTAFTSRYHWNCAGGGEEAVVADWMVSRAAAATGFASLATVFALRAYESAEGGDGPEWLIASTAEGVVRAYAAANDPEARDRWYAVAQGLVDAIADEDDRRLIAEQLRSIPR